MNTERIQQAIAIMRRAQNLDMVDFQQGNDIATTEAELHACGNTACFAGYVAISPEFKQAGGGGRCAYTREYRYSRGT